MRVFPIGCCLLSSCIWLASQRAYPENHPPNILLIISDDQGWGDYGFMGHEAIQTPNIDRLARNGRVFTRGYVVSSLCRPSLATIATGLYPHEHGITGNDPAGDRADRTTLNAPWVERFETLPRVAALLAERGYISHQSGKWWEGECQCGGFTEGMTHGEPDRGGRHGDAGLRIGRETMQPIFEFIDSAGEAPWFVWYAPFLPHQPHNPPERLLKKYRAADRPDELAAYYAMCEWLDETVGQLLAHLDERDELKKTLIVFLADNGWIQPTPNRPPAERRSQGAPRGKGSPYDGGLRTPIILSWPGHVDDVTIEKPVSSIDIAPTILTAAGVKIPDDISGVDLLDYDAVNDRGAVFGAVYTHDMVAIDKPELSLQWRWVVRDDWKLIVPHEPVQKGDFELFHLLNDPHERTNRADVDVETLEALRGALDGWWDPTRAASGR